LGTSFFIMLVIILYHNSIRRVFASQAKPPGPVTTSPVVCQGGERSAPLRGQISLVSQNIKKGAKKIRFPLDNLRIFGIIGVSPKNIGLDGGK
jgi:hypothetical protein